MKKIFFSISVLFILCGNILLFAQDKLLTIDEAVLGQYRQFYPEYIRQLQWRAKTDFYTYVENENLMQGDVKSKEIKSVLTLSELNKVLEKQNVLKLSYFPEYLWVDNNSIKFTSENHIIEYNVNLNMVSVNLKYDENAQNEDYCYKNSKLAYTIENNLYIAGIDGELIQVTKDTEKGIVNGQIVHRNEFGIDKGTFWSPKGNYLAYYRMDETMVTDYPLVDITKRIAETDNIKYPMAGMKSHEVKLAVYNLKNNTKVYLKTGEPVEQYLTNIAWSPDEKYIFIAVLNREQNYLKLNQYDAITGDFIKIIFEEKNDKYVEPLHPIVFLETKPNEFIWQSQRDGYNHIYHYNTDGKLINQVTKGNWVVTDFIGFNKDETEIYYMSTQQSPIESHLYKANISNGKITKLSNETGSHSCSVSKTDNYIIDSYSSTDVSNQYNILDNNGKIVKNLLTSKNPLSDYKLAEMKIFTIKAADNKTDLYCRLIKPLNFDPAKKYPVIVYVYGGPHDQLVQNSWLGGAPLWDYYMAQKGYIVFTVDNRGSANRGLEFENIIHRNVGTAEMEDQMKGIDYLKQLGYADINRIGVYGWSYGGFMTISMMTKHNEIFKVGVAGGPVIDWKYYEVMYGERYMDTPQDNPEGYKNASLINQAKNLKGKLLVIHGGIDNTVVWQHSLLFINECINNGIPVDYFVYPRDEHNVRGTKRLHLMKKITAYFDDYL